MASGRGETKFGSARLQNVGSTAQSQNRGGVIIPRSIERHILINGATAQTVGNYGIVFIAHTILRQIDLAAGAVPPEYQLSAVRERHEVAGSDAGAVTLDVVRVPSGTAKGAGLSMLAAPLSLKTVADTNQDAVLLTTLSRVQLNDGDAVALVATGVLTALSGLALVLVFRRV